jgi:hypothetical protein
VYGSEHLNCRTEKEILSVLRVLGGSNFSHAVLTLVEMGTATKNQGALIFWKTRS